MKILDFGVAKLTEAAAGALGQTATLAGVVVGTVGYVSPEQVRGQALDHRTDIFSLGVVLYEMLSGEAPFKAGTAADSISTLLNREPPPLDVVGRNIPPALDEIVRRCMDPAPSRRFQSARDLAFALRILTGARATAQISTTSIDPRTRKGLWLIGTLALLGVAVAAGHTPIPGMTADDAVAAWTVNARELWVKPARAQVLQIVDVVTGQRRPGRVLNTSPGIQPVDLRATPDGSTYVYNYLDAQSTLYLVRGLR